MSSHLTLVKFFAVVTFLALGCHNDVLAQTEIVQLDSLWTYLSPIGGAAEDPELADGNFDSTWFTAGYDDAFWDGPATGPFSYGGIVGLDTNFPTLTPLNQPPSGDRYTNYFRHQFTTLAPRTNLGLDILADDGAVIYLDGQELLRFNCCVDEDRMPADDDYLNFGTEVGSEGLFRFIRLENLTLDPGDHLLAASNHQVSTTSSDLGFGLRLLSDVAPPEPPDPNIITVGIDTTLASVGQRGPDTPHGDQGSWEWDGDDGGGSPNHGLIWFDIPEGLLDRFGNGTATLQMLVTDSGSSGNVHRVFEDWLSGPDGGDNVTWNNIPGGPGLFLDGNVEEEFSFVTGDITAGDTLEFDVTEDVRSWAAGDTDNYGWGFIPTGNDGAGIVSFEDLDPMVRPRLILNPEIDFIPGAALITPGPFRSSERPFVESMRPSVALLQSARAAARPVGLS